MFFESTKKNLTELEEPSNNDDLVFAEHQMYALDFDFSEEESFQVLKQVEKEANQHLEKKPFS